MINTSLDLVPVENRFGQVFFCLQTFDWLHNSNGKTSAILVLQSRTLLSKITFMLLMLIR